MICAYVIAFKGRDRMKCTRCEKPITQPPRNHFTVIKPSGLEYTFCSWQCLVQFIGHETCNGCEKMQIKRCGDCEHHKSTTPFYSVSNVSMRDVCKCAEKPVDTLGCGYFEKQHTLKCGGCVYYKETFSRVRDYTGKEMCRNGSRDATKAACVMYANV